MNEERLDSIFDDIDQYTDAIDDLVVQLQQCGVKNFEDFKDAARRRHVAVKRSIQDALKKKFEHSEEDDWANASKTDTLQSYQKYLDMYPDGCHREEARDKMKRINEREKQDASEAAWEGLDKNSSQDLNGFIDRYPSSQHVEDARKMLKELKRREWEYSGPGSDALKQEIADIETDPNIIEPDDEIYKAIKKYIERGHVTVDEFLKMLQEDSNLIDGEVAYRLWDSNIISDFSDSGIGRDFMSCVIRKKSQSSRQIPFMSRSIAEITKVPCTEVYFWGIPSSGKTCALGAIMSVANSGKVAESMQKDTRCQGFGYMTRLSEIFGECDGKVGILPPGTPVTSTYEMGFELRKGNNIYPFTFIDLAGELIRCMYKSDAGENLTKEQQEVLKLLTDVLVSNRTKNRKIHFFVIEYGAENRLYEGLSQKTYLESAVAYLKKHQIFKDDTDGIYILISKADRLRLNGEALNDKLRAYINDKYKGFYGILKSICKDYEINGGEVLVQPFTLGKVCFQNYFKFDSATAQSVVNILLEKSYNSKGGRAGRWLEKLR